MDASQIFFKGRLWNEKYKAIKKRLKTFNNNTAKKMANDTQERIGCKVKKKFWYGYKRHIAVCMKFRLIIKVAVTPANVLVWSKALNVYVRKKVRCLVARVIVARKALVP